MSCKFCWSVIASLVCLVASSPAVAGDSIGRAAFLAGQVELVREGRAMPLAVGETVQSTDVVATGERARVKLLMDDGTSIFLGRNSRIDLGEYTLSKTSLFRAALQLLWGKARFLVTHLKISDASFSVTTSTAVLGVRGTDFIVAVERPEHVRPSTAGSMPGRMPTTVLLQQGLLSVRSYPKGGEILLKPGYLAIVGVDGKVSVRTYNSKELEQFGSGLSDANGTVVTPPVIVKPNVTVPVVVQPATVKMGTMTIQTGPAIRAGPPTTTTIQVPVSVQPPVITQVPAN